MIRPTIGRVVWYFRGQSDQPEAALVTYVHSDQCINIGGFDKDGRHIAASEVYLHQDGDLPEGLANWCEWMPYQKGQAAKTEAAEAAAGAQS